MALKIVSGNLFELADSGNFDVIAHGCNCQCKQASGIAKEMVKRYKTNDPKLFRLEDEIYKGDYNKMGVIDFNKINGLTVVNCYTQFKPGEATPPHNIPLDYDMLRCCMRKLNQVFRGKRIGLPLIGGGLAKGKWDIIIAIFRAELTHVDATLVLRPDIYKKLPAFIKK